MYRNDVVFLVSEQVLHICDVERFNRNFFSRLNEARLMRADRLPNDQKANPLQQVRRKTDQRSFFNDASLKKWVSPSSNENVTSCELHLAIASIRPLILDFLSVTFRHFGLELLDPKETYVNRRDFRSIDDSQIIHRLN